jgi:hypothetical protein
MMRLEVLESPEPNKNFVKGESIVCCKPPSQAVHADDGSLAHVRVQFDTGASVLDRSCPWPLNTTCIVCDASTASAGCQKFRNWYMRAPVTSISKLAFERQRRGFFGKEVAVSTFVPSEGFLPRSMT